MALVLYNSLIANTGIVNAKGGAGGNGGVTNSDSGWCGSCGSDRAGGGGGCYDGSGQNGMVGAPSFNTTGYNGISTTNACGASGGTAGMCNNTYGRLPGGSGGGQGASDSYHYKILQNIVF